MTEISATGTANHGMMLKNDDDIFFFSPEGEIQVQRQGIWEKLADTAFQNVKNVTYSADMLYIAYGYNLSDDHKKTPSSLVKFDIKNGNTKILASSRRNPPLSPLDNCPSWSISMMACSASGILSFYIIDKNDNGTIYELDTVGNKWKIDNDKSFFRKEKFDIFKTKEGYLKRINLAPLKTDPNYNEGRLFRKISLTTGNGEKVLRITQLDECLFEIKAIDMNNLKITESRFSIDKKYFPEDANFIYYFVASEKRVYIVFGSNRLMDLTLLAFDLEALLKSGGEKPGL